MLSMTLSMREVVVLYTFWINVRKFFMDKNLFCRDGISILRALTFTFVANVSDSVCYLPIN